MFIDNEQAIEITIKKIKAPIGDENRRNNF